MIVFPIEAGKKESMLPLLLVMLSASQVCTVSIDDALWQIRALEEELDGISGSIDLLEVLFGQTIFIYIYERVVNM